MRIDGCLHTLYFEMPTQHNTYCVAGNIGRGLNFAVWWFLGNPPNLKSAKHCFNLLYNVN